MVSAPYNNYLLSNQDTNSFLVKAEIELLEQPFICSLLTEPGLEIFNNYLLLLGPIYILE